MAPLRSSGYFLLFRKRGLSGLRVEDFKVLPFFALLYTPLMEKAIKTIRASRTDGVRRSFIIPDRVVLRLRSLNSANRASDSPDFVHLEDMLALRTTHLSCTASEQQLIDSVSGMAFETLDNQGGFPRKFIFKVTVFGP